MASHYVIVANAASARFFRLQETDIPEMESSPNLVEERSMENPAGALADRELFADNKTGRNREPRQSVGGFSAVHGYDDHRDQHRREDERRFAEEICRKAIREVDKSGYRKVTISADPRMLGLLRPELNNLRKRDVTVSEHDGDLANLSPSALHDYLASHKLLPERQAPSRLRGSQSHPRGKI